MLAVTGLRRTGAGMLLSTAVLAFVAAPAVASSGDPLRPQQYGLETARFSAAWPASAGRGVVIAVIDTGVDLTHPDLAGKLVPGRDFVDGDTVPQDENGHGTHVAGIAAAATGNGVGGSGAAPDARIMPVRVLDADGTGDPATIAQAIEWSVGAGARVINLSLGGAGLAARLLKGGQLNAAIRDASARGAIVVAAAGNDGAPRRAFRLAVPVIVVNAVDRAGDIAEFSTYGDTRAVSAPGVDVLSTTPRAATTLFPAGTNGYGRLSGTSMATPFVAAEAALLLAQGRTPAQAGQLIADTARNPSGDPRLGAGLVDAAAAVSSSGRSGTAGAPGGPSPAPTARTGGAGRTVAAQESAFGGAAVAGGAAAAGVVLVTTLVLIRRRDRTRTGGAR